jgi:outer membrane protein OmpA-like peptidoglycan-associated protein
VDNTDNTKPRKTKSCKNADSLGAGEDVNVQNCIEDSIEDNNEEDKEKANEFLQLRELIIGEKQLAQLDQLDSNKTQFVADVISEAIQERNRQDQSISTALSVSIQGVLQRSIKDNPQQIADTLFPIIGPAIRKSVAAALAEMVQSLNHLLENSLSARSLSWRYQAWRSGSKYAEFVLLKTLKYRVEQVFFICRESGLLIQSVHAGDVKYEDPDLVSSMLSAINDFVKDSFANQELSIDRLQFGDQSLHIIVGPHAILAASAKGTVGDSVHVKLQDTLESLHQNHAVKLKSFDGDKDDWRVIIPDLEACLLSKSISKDKSGTPWLAIIAILFGILYFAFLQYKSYVYDREASQIIDSIKHSEGYVITDWRLDNDVLSIDAVRFADKAPLAAYVRNFSNATSELKLQILEQELSPLSKDMQLLFIKDLLRDIKTIEIKWLNQQLYISGSMNQDEFDKLRQSVFFAKYNHSINTIDLEITTIDPQKALLEQYNKALTAVNSSVILFSYGSVELSDDMRPVINNLSHHIKILREISPEIGKQVDQILLLGYADSKGAGKSNNMLSLKRAASVKNILVHNGIPEHLLFVWGQGDIEGLPVSESQQRRVSVNVYESSI